MKRLFILPVFCTLSIFFRSGFSQINIPHVTFEVTGINVYNICSAGYGPSDTIEIGFTSVPYPNLSVNGDTISASGGYHGLDSYIHNSSLNIILDTINKKIVKLYTDDSESHSTFMGSPAYAHTDDISFGAQDIPYVLSATKDTLFSILDAAALRKTYINIDKYSSDVYPHNSFSCNASSIVGISDNASFKLIATSSFPLTVQNISSGNKIYIFMDVQKGILKILIGKSEKAESVSCFDILGRKHNLEFLGADNTSATYSVRSLRPGVYFVNDGRETVKFIIGE